MQYPIFIHKNKNSAYGVIVPDLPGCYSACDTIEEAIENVHEAIALHIEGLLSDNEYLPLKKSVEEHLYDPDLKGVFW